MDLARKVRAARAISEIPVKLTVSRPAPRSKAIPLASGRSFPPQRGRYRLPCRKAPEGGKRHFRPKTPRNDERPAERGVRIKAVGTSPWRFPPSFEIQTPADPRGQRARTAVCIGRPLQGGRPNRCVVERRADWPRYILGCERRMNAGTSRSSAGGVGNRIWGSGSGSGTREPASGSVFHSFGR